MIMGNRSCIMLATTKKDFEKLKKQQEKIPDNYISRVLEEGEFEERYKVNDQEFVYTEIEEIKYYKEYEDVQLFEKNLSKLKDGYVFCRLGEINRRYRIQK